MTEAGARELLNPPDIAELRRVNALLVRTLRNCGEVANDKTAVPGARLHQIAVYCRAALKEAEKVK